MAPRGVIGTQPLHSQTAEIVGGLQMVPLLRDLSSDALALLAAACRVVDIRGERIRTLLVDLERTVIFVADGQFEKVLVQGSTILQLAELGPGGLWGEHLLLRQNPTGERPPDWRLSIRPLTRGRLIAVPHARFFGFVKLHDQLFQALLTHIVTRDLDQQCRLAEAEAKLRDSRWILDRIESLADMMASSSDGKTTDAISIQRRFCLRGLPSLNDGVWIGHRLEQAYLKVDAEREDRIRSEDERYFERTTKYGSGLSRKHFSRRISREEYVQLLNRTIGQPIRKTRYKRTYKYGDQNCTLSLDVFDGPLAGLIILEADFTSEADSQVFSLPDDLLELQIDEVTGDKRLSNHNLSINGFPAELGSSLFCSPAK